MKKHASKNTGIGRRRFLGHLAAGLGTCVLLRNAFAEPASGATIDVMLDDAGPTISRDNFGYLMEFAGASIYDGVWVGEHSRIPNVGGIRRQLIEHLQKIDASLIRWPGGCYADIYDWRDGIGARAQRPRRTALGNDYLPAEVGPGPQRFDPNEFGTDEFMQLCQITGARPFLGVNIRGLTPHDLDRWAEYCNSPAGSTTLADQRSQAGSPAPYNVRYWSIGNEVWGCGGAMTVEEYLPIYKRFVEMFPRFGLAPVFVASGARTGRSLAWVGKFLEGINDTLTETPLGALSIHYYAGLPSNQFPAGQTEKKALAGGNDLALPDALDFDVPAWYYMLKEYDGIEEYINRHWQLMAQFDRTHETKLAVDEWGAICKRGVQLSPVNILSRPVTLRDALGAALTLDIFNRHSDKVTAACFNGLINHEGGLFMAEGEKFVATPIYHTFQMYAAHQGGQRISTDFAAPEIGYTYRGRAGSLWGLNGSASRKGQTLTLTVVNPHASESIEATVALRGGEVKSGTVTTLTHADIHAQNTFADPAQVRPAESALGPSGSNFRHRFPAASVSRLSLVLRDNG